MGPGSAGAHCKLHGFARQIESGKWRLRWRTLFIAQLAGHFYMLERHRGSTDQSLNVFMWLDRCERRARPHADAGMLHSSASPICPITAVGPEIPNETGTAEPAWL